MRGFYRHFNNNLLFLKFVLPNDTAADVFLWSNKKIYVVVTVTSSIARSWSLDGSLKLKNVLGYGDNWYSSLSYDWDQTTEISTGVSLPKFMRLGNPVMAHLSLLSQDWLKFTSYKERTVGVAGFEGDKSARTFNAKSIEIVWWPIWDEDNPYRRNCGPKANVVVISQTYLRHLFEEGNLSVHIILRSHPLVGFNVSRCPPGQALQIFRWLWKNLIFTLDFSVVRKSSHVTVDIFVLALSPPTIPKVKIPEDTLRQVVGAVRIEVNNFLGMLRDVASGRDLKKFLAVVAALWVLSIVGSWFPVLYEKYEDQVDACAEKAMIEFKKQYAIFDAKVLSKIPKGFVYGRREDVGVPQNAEFRIVGYDEVLYGT
ncbi:reticulon-like protein B1 [Tanacetum coccineum]